MIDHFYKIVTRPEICLHNWRLYCICFFTFSLIIHLVTCLFGPSICGATISLILIYLCICASWLSDYLFTSTILQQADLPLRGILIVGKVSLIPE